MSRAGRGSASHGIRRGGAAAKHNTVTHTHGYVRDSPETARSTSARGSRGPPGLALGPPAPGGHTGRGWG
eukprot:scaffold1496_cov110-Isochrysis_galbana.AAC.13